MDFNSVSKLLTATGLLLLLTACGGDDGESDSRVVISTSNVIIPLNVLQYQLPIVVQVADSDGSPQVDTTVFINVRTIGYDKGGYVHVDTDIPADNTTDKWVQSVANPFTCPAEDTNNNIILDTGEDANGNGHLDPNTPTITPHPSEIPTLLIGTSTIVTDSNGFGYLTLSYPKAEASWVKVRLTATAQDALPENKGIAEFWLFKSLPDVDKPIDEPPAFKSSPYGFSANCANPD